jgi:hypothetical protein
LQAKRQYHDAQANLKQTLNQSTLKMKEVEAKLELWKPNKANCVENRIKALSQLG